MNTETGETREICETSSESENTSRFKRHKIVSFECGEHLACVWHDENENCLKWYIGVVDGVEDDDSILVSYMHRGDKKGIRWLFPEEAEIVKTHPDQIILRNIQVSYTLTAIIRCELSKVTLETIENIFDKYDR